MMLLFRFFFFLNRHTVAVSCRLYGVHTITFN